MLSAKCRVESFENARKRSKRRVSRARARRRRRTTHTTRGIHDALWRPKRTRVGVKNGGVAEEEESVWICHFPNGKSRKILQLRRRRFVQVYEKVETRNRGVHRSCSRRHRRYRQPLHLHRHGVLHFQQEARSQEIMCLRDEVGVERLCSIYHAFTRVCNRVSQKICVYYE